MLMLIRACMASFVIKYLLINQFYICHRVPRARNTHRVNKLFRFLHSSALALCTPAKTNNLPRLGRFWPMF